MSKFKIFIVEEQAIFRAGIRQTLASMKEKVECTEITTAAQLLPLLETQQPDMIILSMALNDNDMNIIDQLVKNNQKTKILLFADRVEDELLIRLIEGGLFGCLLRSVDTYELKLAIEMARTNQTYFSPQLVNRLLLHRFVPRKNGAKKLPDESTLTGRELEIVKLLCKGHDQQEIAEKLFISPRTVDAHKANIMSKLEVKNTTGIILHALRTHVIKLEELA